jgi:quercetin dioxygenase-like cupin family protein
VKSRVIPGRGATWPALPVREYKDRPELFRDVTRRVLLGGAAGDPAAGGDLAFELRYFEIAPGGHSTLEHHRHPHAVVVITGRGEVRLGADRHEIEPFDVVYVAPGEAHQFLASRGEPLGFLCVVDRERDRPIPLAEGDGES